MTLLLNTHLPFQIVNLSVEEAKNNYYLGKEPGNHDFEKFIFCNEGEVEYCLGNKICRLVAPYAGFIGKEKMHDLKSLCKNGKCNIWVVYFKSEFVPDIIPQLYCRYFEFSNLKIADSQSRDQITAICELMFQENQQPGPRYGVIHHMLKALFTIIELEQKQSIPHNRNLQKKQNSSFQIFLGILEENFRRPEGVAFYAKELLMSTRNLNLVCHNILHKSATEIIETRKHVEAKNLLLNSEKNICEIGSELGYHEKAYFSTVFKKKSGQTPTKYREEMAKLAC